LHESGVKFFGQIIKIFVRENVVFFPRLEFLKYRLIYDKLVNFKGREIPL